ncbi:Eukaryotic translation initiation factor 2C [Podila humilis]|nr:Eukaryotic translation initiation factor 2C [Podila humilis]
MSSTASTSHPPIPLSQNTPRPDKGGSQGRITQVRANFFAIKQLPVDTIWHYDVTISPELPPARARALWKQVEKLEELSKTKVVFDGRSNAYSGQELNFGKAQCITRKVILPDGTVSAPSSAKPTGAKNKPTGAKNKPTGAKNKPASTSAPPPKTANEFTVKIALVFKIELEELHRFLNKKGPVTAACFTAIQALNIAMSHKVFSEMVSFGRSAFTPNNAQNLGGGVEKWDGIFQSIRPGQGKLFANIDVASTAFIKGGNAATVVAEVVGARGVEDIPNSGILPRHIDSVRRVLKGASFTVTHRGADFKRRYKIANLSLKSADNTTFEQTLNNGSKKTLSITQYYATAYNHRLMYPHLPCFGVNGKNGDVLYFPLEVCVIVPGQKYMKKLDPSQTAEMIKGTCMKPEMRAGKIRANINSLNFDANEYMKSFKLSVDKDMAVVPARVLPAPQILYALEKRTKPQFGGWKLDPSLKAFSGAKLSSWGVLVYENEQKFPKTVVNSFLRELTTTLVENGLQVPIMNPPVKYAQGMEVENNVNSIWTQVESECKAPPQFILVVLPSVCATYSAIKTYCETTGSGKITQCVLSNKIRKANKQYCGMLGLKINTKLGGINNVLTRDAVPFCSSAPTMVIGADVTHPAPGETSRPSVCAVVGSLDQYVYKFAGRLQVQDGRMEMIERLKYLVHELLVTFQSTNRGTLPAKILFYRDGVSEGQFAEVMRTEVAAVKEACRRINPKYNPPVTFVIVKKRHHARFFPMQPKDADKSGNCLAGTVVDQVITHPSEFDFYLQSHGGLQGTSRPTLYHVIHDENKFTSDHMQELTYRLCHTYARCPKSVSIVPAVYYAHLLAYRARHYQGGEFSDAGSSSSGGSNTSFQNFQINAQVKNRMYFV